MSPLSMYDHVRTVDADCPPGIYRDVGRPMDEVVPLRVGDVDDRRVHRRR